MRRLPGSRCMPAPSSCDAPSNFALYPSSVSACGPRYRVPYFRLCLPILRAPAEPASLPWRIRRAIGIQVRDYKNPAAPAFSPPNFSCVRPPYGNIRLPVTSSRVTHLSSIARAGSKNRRAYRDFRRRPILRRKRGPHQRGRRMYPPPSQVLLNPPRRRPQASWRLPRWGFS